MRLSLLQSRQVLLVIILLLIIVSQLGADIIVPALPTIKSYFGSTSSNAKLIISVFLLGQAIAQLSTSFIPFRHNKQFIIFSLSIIMFFSLILTLTRNIFIFLVFRMIQGFGAGLLNIGIKQLIRNIFKGKSLAKVVSLASSTWCMVPIVAPIIGGYFVHFYKWQTAFYFLSVFCLFCVSLATYILPGIILDFRKMRFLEWLELFKDVQLLKAIYFSGATYGILIAFITVASISLQENFSYSPVGFGWTTAKIAFGYLIGTLINIKLVSNHNFNFFINFGIVANFCISFLMLMSSVILPYKYIHYIIYGIFLLALVMGFIFPNATTLVMHLSDGGKKLGILGFGQILICSAVGVIAAVQAQTLTELYLLIGSLATSTFILYLVLEVLRK